MGNSLFRNILIGFIFTTLLWSCVKDETFPIISIYSEVYNEAQAIKSDTISFKIKAFDENGIKELTLIKDGETLQKVSGEILNFEWFTANEDTGRHHFTIKAIDNEGNQNDDYLWVYINNITFINVDGGSFLMGSEEGEEDARPHHTVTLDAYQIMATEVTMGQFICFLNAIDCPKDGWVNGKRYFYENWSQTLFNTQDEYYKVYPDKKTIQFIL